MKRWLTELMLMCAAVSGVWAAEEKQPIKPFRPLGIVIHAAAARPLITDFGYDVKQPGKAKAFSVEEAKTIFGTNGFTCLRIPIWGDVNHPAHPAPGKIVEHFYDTLFDCTDGGATGFVWWAYARKGVKGKIESALSSSLVHAQPLPVDDGNPKMNYDSLFTRAFKKEKAITLWVINNSEKANKREIKINRAAVSGKAAFRQWTIQESSAGSSEPVAGAFSFSFPARTVTMITMPITMEKSKK